jgi:hypothetical protein
VGFFLVSCPLEPANFPQPAHYTFNLTAFLVTAALLGLCAEAMAGPMSFATRTIDKNQSFGVWAGVNAIPTDFDFPMVLIGDLIFTGQKPAGESITPTPAPGDLTRTGKPPIEAFLAAGFACLGIFGLLRRFRAGVNLSRQHGEGN